MNKDLANFSTDLLRISYWIHQGQDVLARKFLAFCRTTYLDVNPNIGCYQNIWDEIKRIDDFGNDRLHAAERALTLSRIMMMYTDE